jgi:hypothetical protein
LVLRGCGGGDGVMRLRRCHVCDIRCPAAHRFDRIVPLRRCMWLKRLGACDL